MVKQKPLIRPEAWLSSVTKADGAVMTFAYDKTGNLTAQNVGEGQSIQNSYNEIGQVTTVKNNEGTIKYQYNQQGYLVSVTNVNGDVVSYTYDEYGNKTSMTYPDGRAVRYTYDSMNRMTSVTGLDGEVTTYAYDAAGRRVETASRTLTTEYTYDAVGNLSRQKTTGSSNIHFQYTYNLNGYITGEVRTENGAAVESLYTYDPLGELTSFTQSTGYGEQYVYDKAGNMTAKTITGTDGQTVALKMTYNKGNQLVSMTNGKDKLTYGYDKNGSMVQKVLSSKQFGKLTDTYAYNSLDQLVSYTGYDGYQQRFSYDANGMRLSKSEYGNSNRSTLEELLRGDIAGLPEIVAPDVAATSTDETAIPAEYEWATTEYLYDITQEYYQVIEQTTTKDNTTTTTAYAYGVERIAAYDTNATTQYIYDGRGSVAQTISAPAAGTSVSAALPQVEVQSYSYTAFGEQMGSKTSGFAYNAEDYDAGTGMINLRARQYDVLGNRFVCKDPIHKKISRSVDLNLYVFVVNSPLNRVDANGQESELIPLNYYVYDIIFQYGKKQKQSGSSYTESGTMIENARNMLGSRETDCSRFIARAIDQNTPTGMSRMFREHSVVCGTIESLGEENLLPGMILGNADLSKIIQYENGLLYQPSIDSGDVSHGAMLEENTYLSETPEERTGDFWLLESGTTQGPLRKRYGKDFPLQKVTQHTGFNIWMWAKGVVPDSDMNEFLEGYVYYIWSDDE